MTILAVDYGKRRIGLATSASGVLATPDSVITHEGNMSDAVEQIAKRAEELEASTIVVGVPRSDAVNAARREAPYLQLAELLRQRTCSRVVLWNEAYTTAEAQSRRRDAGKHWRRERKEIDMQAAAVILQSYLDETSRGTP